MKSQRKRRRPADILPMAWLVPEGKSDETVLALYPAAKEPFVYGYHERKEVGDCGREQEGSRHCREKRQDSEAVYLAEVPVGK